MSPSIVETVTDEVSRDPGLRTVNHFECGENGDAFLNPEAMDCLRIIKQKLPDCTVGVFTNFQTLDAPLIDEILQNKLIDRFDCNIDGHDEEHYRSVKGVGLRRAEDNLLHFLGIRRRLKVKVPLHIMAVSYSDYVATVQRYLGVLPAKANGRSAGELECDFHRIWRKWKPLLDPKTDRIQRVRSFFGWAERSQCADRGIAYGDYTCPALDRVKQEAFIAPDGTWYGCCMDAECELVIGNVTMESLALLVGNERRTRLISGLENREFARIGGPCRTVQCCQTMILDTPIDKLAQVVRNSPFGEGLRNLCAKSTFLRDCIDRVRG